MIDKDWIRKFDLEETAESPAGVPPPPQTIEYWHPKRGIGGPALEDSDHAYLYTVKETAMEPIVAMVKKYDRKRHFWVVRPLQPASQPQYHLLAGDFDYEDVAVNDMVELYYTDSPDGAGYRARRHIVKPE